MEAPPRVGATAAALTLLAEIVAELRARLERGRSGNPLIRATYDG